MARSNEESHFPYCKECGKYFDNPDELEVHKNVRHGGKQNTLFEQLTPQYLDQQNIMIEDQNFSLPPPRKHADYNEAKTNWEGMWEDERIKVLQDGMLDTEYAEYSFSKLPEDVRNKIYFTLQKYATTRKANGRENEQNITDNGVSPIEIDDQFDEFEAVKDNEFDPSTLPLASIGVDVAKSLEPYLRNKLELLKKGEAIPTVCPTCDVDFPDPVELYDHLKNTYNLTDEDAMKEARKQMEEWTKRKREEQGESSMLKSETKGPYEISTRNGNIISQYIEDESEVQDIIDIYQSEYSDDHYGSGDAIVIKDKIGNDISRMFSNAVQDWEQVSIENIDTILKEEMRGFGLR